MERILLLIITKIKSIFLKSLSFSSRIEYSEISRKAKIWGKCKVYYSKVDDFSYVGRNSRVIHAQIGKFCSIAGNCIIGMGSHPLNMISTSPIFTSLRNGTGYSWTRHDIFEEYKDVIIDNDVWIGQKAMIMGGVHIGNGAVVGAGSVVTNDVPPYAIVGGVPARIIRYRFSEEIINNLEETKWWNLDDSELRGKLDLFRREINDVDFGMLV